jgi:hypothetical protein
MISSFLGVFSNRVSPAIIPAIIEDIKRVWESLDLPDLLLELPSFTFKTKISAPVKSLFGVQRTKSVFRFNINIYVLKKFV